MSGGGSGGSTTTVTKADPWEKAQPYILRGLEEVEKAALNYPGLPGMMPLAQPSAGHYAAGNELVGRSGLVDAMGTGLYGAAGQQLLRSMSGGYTVPELKNYDFAGLEQTLGATVRPQIEALTEGILPSIASQATAAGAYGGNAQAMAETLALRNLDRTISDTAGRLGFEDLQGMRENQPKYWLAEQNALGQIPGLMQGIGMGPQFALQGLESLRLMDQISADNAYQRYAMEAQRAMEPWERAAGVYYGTGGGQSSSYGTGTAPRTNPLMGAAGGALGGYALSTLPFMAAGPPGWALAGMGALLGAFA